MQFLPYKVFMFVFAALVSGAWTSDFARADSQSPSIRIVGSGDSLMAGYQIGRDEACPAQLQRALQDIGVPATVENAGVSGDTSSGGLARLEWSLGTNPLNMVIVEFCG